MSRVACIVLVVCLLGCDAGDSPREKSQSSWNQSHDLGLAIVAPADRRNLKLRHVFRISNPTTTTLELQPLGSSCGCTQSLITQKAIAPGETGEVEVVIEAAGQSGRVHEYATVKTNVAEHPHIRLSLSAVVLPSLDTTEVPAGPIRVRPAETLSLVFRVNGRQTLDEAETVLSMAGPADPDGLFEATLGPVERRVIDGSYRLTTAEVRLRLKCPNGTSSPSRRVARRTIRFTFGQASLDQLVVWRPDLPIQATPQRVFLRRTPSISTSRVVRLQGTQPFSIIDVSTDNDEITLETIIGQRNTSHELKIIARRAQSAAKEPTADRFEVVVMTDNPEQTAVKILVMLFNTR